jgi:uroporphyrinogen decarboxylase
MNLRQRYTRTLRFQPVDVPFVRAVGGWAETAERWRREGWDGTPLDRIFKTDGVGGVPVYYGPIPRFEYRLVEETDIYRIYINHEGILMREFKAFQGNSSMPQFLKFPVADADEFESFCADRLQLRFEERTPPNWSEHVTAWRSRENALMLFADRWGGFFGPLRNLMGLENLCLAFYDQPALVERMMEQRADMIIEITGRVLDEVEIDVFAFWEDMAFNSASLIDPKQFQRFALKHYRRVVDFVRSRGVEFVGLDSDGDVTELIPIWLDAGINFLWPFEVAAGMDVVQVRRQYGRAFAMLGGIDKRAVARGGEMMRREVDRVMPVVEDGGYIPELDHSAPPDISWRNMNEYMTYLIHRLGRG